MAFCGSNVKSPASLLTLIAISVERAMATRPVRIKKTARALFILIDFERMKRKTLSVTAKVRYILIYTTQKKINKIVDARCIA